jgi:tRNA dimethylallyltransferase
MTEFHRSDQKTSAAGLALPFDLHFLTIQPEQRDLLHLQIANRFRQMLNEGLVKEVEALYQRGDLSPALPAIKSVGYRQVWQYLSGEIDYDAMVEKGIIATRQLAKRQFTWLRSWPELNNLGSQQEKFLDKVLKLVESASI